MFRALSSPSRRSLRPRRFWVAAGALLLLGFSLGGCAQQPQQIAASHGREYFPSSVYGNASRRVIADGQPVPKGGGQYLVGKPYTIAGRTYYPSESKATQVGLASWYGDAFHGRLTANGEIYDRDSLTAASPTMPLPSYVRVTNLRNNYSMVVRVNDRGPYASNRIMDVSRRVAEALDFKRHGTTTLKVQYVGRASLSGSDDARLYATLRTGAPSPGQPAPTMVADIQPPRRTAVAALGGEGTDELVDRQPVAETRSMAEPRTMAEPRAMPRRRFVEQRPVDVESIEPAPRASPRPIRSDRRIVVAARESFEPEAHARTRFEEFPKPELRRPFAPTYEAERRFATPPVRTATSSHHLALPPSRPLDLATIPGADSQIHAAHRPAPWRVARARDD